MSEKFPSQTEASEKLDKAGFIALALELSEKQERFPFPGISPDDYAKAKATDEAFPGYTTPIDELIQKFQTQGMKVALGPHLEKGDVFLLPAESNDIGSDGVFPRQLEISEGMDDSLKKLILANKG